MPQHTPLKDRHEALGAKMVDFAGYLMPLQYSNIKEEHLAVRSNVGLFDVSHMGEFVVRGKQALDLIQSVTSNDASKLEIGQAQYSYLPNQVGGIVDDLLVYRLDEDRCSEGERAYMLVVNAGNIKKDWDWIAARNTYDTDMIDISSRTGLLALQGPTAQQVLQTLTEVDLESIPFYHHKKGAVAGIDNVLISATGYTGSGGYELYVNADKVAELWDALMKVGASLAMVPCGLGCRDTLRLEKGYCLYGNDIDETTSPLQAGLGWITKLKKEADFPSKQLLIDEKASGITSHLVGLLVEARRVPRHGYPIIDQDGNHIGRVTSGSQSPSLNKPIGLGYVTKAFSVAGAQVLIDTGRKLLPATTVKVPFL